jgi:hypothetical protein
MWGYRNSPILRRQQSGLLLEPGDHGTESVVALHTTVIGTWALFDREEPLRNTVAHHLFEILERSAQIEGILPREGVENGEDVPFG